MAANVLFADFLSKTFFIRQPEIICDSIICSFTICPSYPKSHPLSSLSPFFFVYVLGSETNHLKKLSTILSVCCYLCPPFFKNNRAFNIFALKNDYL